MGKFFSRVIIPLCSKRILVPDDKLQLDCIFFLLKDKKRLQYIPLVQRINKKITKKKILLFFFSQAIIFFFYSRNLKATCHDILRDYVLIVHLLNFLS